MKILKLYFSLIACVLIAHGQATINGSTVRIAGIPPSSLAGSCISSTGTDSYTCTVSSQLTYQNGMSMNFRATATACSGPATINMSSKGVKKLFAADGTSDPACLQNLDYRISYDAALDSGAGAWKISGGSSSGSTQIHTITFVVDGGGSAITTGGLGVFVSVPFSCTINRWDVTGAPSGSVTLDIWKKAAGIPTSTDKISASAPIALSSAALAQNGSLTGWTTSVSAGDVFGATVASVSTVQKVTAVITCQ